MTPDAHGGTPVEMRRRCSGATKQPNVDSIAPKGGAVQVSLNTERLNLILGIDPGSRADNPTGWALVDADADRLLECGLLKPHGKEITANLPDLARQFQGLVYALHGRLPHGWRIAIEQPWVGANARTCITLARIVGAYEGIAAQAGVAVRLVTPAEGKAALAGNGKADKAAMLQMVQLRYGLAVPEHVADAIGVALAAVEWGA